MPEEIGLSVKIDAAAVEKMVADAILQSALGDAIQESIDRSLASLKDKYRNPMDEVIKQHISRMVNRVLIDKHEAEIRAAVEKHLAELLTDDLLRNISRAAIEKLGLDR